MNEQDLLLKEKIEKREKFDTILAYILLVILSGAILLVLYLKFVRDEDTEPSIEYIPNYISLNELSNSFNNSNLVNTYSADGASIVSNNSNNSLEVTYKKENNNISLVIPTVGNELEVRMSEMNKEVATDVYKEIASIICVYYGTPESDCRNMVSNIDENSSVDGIRFSKIDDTNTVVYIDYTKGLFVNNNGGNIYTTATSVELSDTNYVVNMFDTEINNISVVNDNTSIRVSGNIQRLTDNRSNITVMVKLYDIDGNELASNSQVFDENNFVSESGSFDISFINGDNLDLTNVSRYSIEIIK